MRNDHQLLSIKCDICRWLVNTYESRIWSHKNILYLLLHLMISAPLQIYFHADGSYDLLLRFLQLLIIIRHLIIYFYSDRSHDVWLCFDLLLRFSQILIIITRLMIFRSALNLFLSWQVWWPSTPLGPSVPQITLPRRLHDLSAILICRRLHYEHMFCFRNSLCGGRRMTCLPFPSAGASVMNTRSAFAIHFAEDATWPVCHSHPPVPRLWTHVLLSQFTLQSCPHDLSAIPICWHFRYEHTFRFRNSLGGGCRMTRSHSPALNVFCFHICLSWTSPPDRLSLAIWVQAPFTDLCRYRTPNIVYREVIN